MHTIRVDTDWELECSSELMQQAQGKRFARLMARPGLAQRFEEILAEMHQLPDPRVAWTRVRVEGLTHDRLLLEGGVALGAETLTQVMAGATDLVVAICTLGPAIDQRTTALQQAKDLMGAVLLEAMANALLGQLRHQFLLQIQEEERDAGRFTSIAMSPGESVWDLRGQQEIFALLGPAPAGVELTASMLMVPLKSVSFVMAVAPQPFGSDGVSRCDFCVHRHKCRFNERGSHSG
jgi:hypothetical protein